MRGNKRGRRVRGAYRELGERIKSVGDLMPVRPSRMSSARGTISLSLPLSFCLFLSLCFSLSISLSLSVSLFSCLYVSLSLSLFFLLSISFSPSLSLGLSLCVFLSLSLNVRVCLSLCLFHFLSLSLSLCTALGGRLVFDPCRAFRNSRSLCCRFSRAVYFSVCSALASESATLRVCAAIPSPSSSAQKSAVTRQRWWCAVRKPEHAGLSVGKTHRDKQKATHKCRLVWTNSRRTPALPKFILFAHQSSSSEMLVNCFVYTALADFAPWFYFLNVWELLGVRAGGARCFLAQQWASFFPAPFYFCVRISEWSIQPEHLTLYEPRFEFALPLPHKQK